MGNSTFIELNNDYYNEIDTNREFFIEVILAMLRSGERDKNRPFGIGKVKFLHRQDKGYKKLCKVIDDL